MDVNKVKLESWQQELNTIVTSYRTALKRHFEVVEIKAKKLIDGRWKEGGNGGT